ncbi:protein phosphatase 2C domain-containing protein [Rossellomorea oryzaecorticis]|uniref:Protein phosphatase 2C domain-containing protein n=1 Tax=Rossellomorea oryzaecorticis TaxID=1396505 RepID=A0ABU9K5S5_9BACI
MHEFSWAGSQEHYVDQVQVKSINDIVVGLFGGNSSAGQFKNEDGCLVWSSPGEWEFVIILDGHDTAESVELVLETLENNKSQVFEIFKQETHETLRSLQDFFIDTFKSDNFREKAKNIQGETACLIVYRKENHLWWLSIGDCILHLFNRELSALGEFQQNHRSFYEWIGNNSTFNKAIPSYSTGIKELRSGENHIFLTTDGLIECPNTHFEEARFILQEFSEGTLEDGVYNLMNEIKRNQVKDSTTIVTWKTFNNLDATIPSDMK